MDARLFPCPDCGLPLAGASSPNCPRCRLPLTGPEADELWQVDAALADLGARRDGLLRRRAVLVAALRGHRAGPGAPGAQSGGAGAWGAAARAAGARVPGTPRQDASAPSVQTVLLVAGGLLVTIAGLVFTLVNWGRLGIGGRAVVLAGLTALALGVPLPLRRRRLTATAEAAAAVGLALLLLDCYAARAAGLAGLQRADAAAYWAAVTGLAAVGAAAYGWFIRSAVMQGAGLLLLQCVAPLTAVAAGTGTTGWAMALAGAAAIDLGAATVLRAPLARRISDAAAAAVSQLGRTAGAVCAVLSGLLAGDSALGATGYGTVLRAEVPLALLVVLGAVGARRQELPYRVRLGAAVLCGLTLATAVAAAPRLALPGSWAVLAHAVPGALLATAALALRTGTATTGTATGPGSRSRPLWSGLAASGALVLASAASAVLPALLRALAEPLRRVLPGGDVGTPPLPGGWEVAPVVLVVTAVVAATMGTAAGLVGRATPPAPATGPARTVTPAGVRQPGHTAPATGPARTATPGQTLPPPHTTEAGPTRAVASVQTGTPAEARGPLHGAGAGSAPPPGEAGPAHPPVSGSHHALPPPPLPRHTPGQTLTGPARTTAGSGPGSTEQIGQALCCAAVVTAVATVALVPVAAGWPYGVALAAAWLPALAAAVHLVRRPAADRATQVCGLIAPAVLALVWSLPGAAATLTVWGATALLAAGLAAALWGDARGRGRVAAGASAFAVAALGVEAARAGTASGLPPHLAAFAVLGVAAATVPAAAVLRSVAVERAGYGTAVAALLMTAAHPHALSVALGVSGAAALGTALRADRRRAAALVATAALTASSWVRLALADVAAPEPYTVTVSAAALVLGHLRRRRDPGTGSWSAYGAGLGVTLVPALGAAWADTHWLRPLLLGGAALAVTLLGARHRLQAPLLTGGAVLVADALHELAPAITQALGLLPRWVPLAAAGVLLLFVGATYEHRLKDARRLGDGLRRMV